MAKTHQNLQVAPKLRPGEAETIRIQKVPVTQADGSVILEVGLDLGDAPVPARRYAAEVAAVLHEPELVRVCFGQRKIVGRDLRSLLVLAITPDHLAGFLRSCEQFWPQLQAYVDREQVQSILCAPIATEPDQVVSMATNVIAAAFTGREACIDCYHLSPFVSRNIQQRSEIALDPVVRVDLPTALLFSLMGQLFEIRPSLHAEHR